MSANSSIFYPIVSVLYAALAMYFWRTRWQTATVSAGEERAAFEPYIMLVPLVLHAILLFNAVIAGDGVHLGVGNAISVIVWLTVAIYWIGNLFYRIEGLQALVMPVAAVCAMIALLAYSFFTIASLHVLLMAVIENRLHSGGLPYALRRLPALLTMETLLFRIILAGFVLLTLTLGTGIVYSEELFGKAMRFNHKTVFGILSWLIFAALLGGRWRYGWRGRIAVRWTLTGFLMLVLAYIGSKFVLEIILGRS